MSAAFSFTRVFVRLVGLALTLLGVVIMVTQNPALVPVYATVAVGLMLGVWTLAVLVARAGVHAGFVVPIVILGLVGVAVS